MQCKPAAPTILKEFYATEALASWSPQTKCRYADQKKKNLTKSRSEIKSLRQSHQRTSKEIPEAAL
jgi:hypothetical protein